MSDFSRRFFSGWIAIILGSIIIPIVSSFVDQSTLAGVELIVMRLIITILVIVILFGVINASFKNLNLSH